MCWSEYSLAWEYKWEYAWVLVSLLAWVLVVAGGLWGQFRVRFPPELA